MNESLRVALAGCGSYGRHLATSFHSAPETEIVAVADVDGDAAGAAGQELGIRDENCFTDYEAMLDAIGADADAVLIATPNGLHHEQTVAALDRGLHVYLEKPLATTVEDAHDLLGRSEAADETVMVGYQRHRNPAYDLARERWALGEREPVFVTGEITHDWRSYYETMDDWRMDPELSGGGHLLNVGTHVVDAILWTTGLTPTAVTAYVDFHDEAEILDRQSASIVEFAEGAVATISDTGLAARTREHVHVWDGEEGVYLEGREWDARCGYVIDADGTEHDPYHGGGQTAPAAFVEAIRTDEDPPATVRDAFRATVVTLAAYEAGRRGERVEVTDLYPYLESGLFEGP